LNRPERSGRAEPVGAILRELVQSRPWSSGISIGKLGRQWPEVVGDRLATECAPFRMEGTILLVRASSAAWATQLRFLAEEVARRANEVLGTEAVRAVRVVVEGDR
jgi:predicted nucleic acid-binding Zn ribbon protein